MSLILFLFYLKLLICEGDFYTCKVLQFYFIVLKTKQTTNCAVSIYIESNNSFKKRN